MIKAIVCRQNDPALSASSVFLLFIPASHSGESSKWKAARRHRHGTICTCDPAPPAETESRLWPTARIRRNQHLVPSCLRDRRLDRDEDAAQSSISRRGQKSSSHRGAFQ